MGQGIYGSSGRVSERATANRGVLQCWSTNVKGNMYLFKAALPTFNANPEGGVFLMTSSIAVGDMCLPRDRVRPGPCSSHEIGSFVDRE